MSKLKLAKIVMGAVWVVIGLLALALLCGIGWLLWLWAGAHFVSFAWIIGILLVIGLVSVIYHAGTWASEVMEKAEEEEKLEEYMQRYGGKKPPTDYYDNYQFDKAPLGWAHREKAESK
jgi:membrane protein implicated in regulation of membrane protease activity